MVRLLISLMFAMSTTACSVYTSEGRKAFESQAPEQLDLSIHSEDELDAFTCWNQPANEALWRVETRLAMTVRKISEEQIEVCLIE